MLTDVPADVRAAVEIMAGDVTDPFLVRRAVSGEETVLHLAALIAIFSIAGLLDASNAVDTLWGDIATDLKNAVP